MAWIEISGKLGGDIHSHASGLEGGSFVVEAVMDRLPVAYGTVDNGVVGNFRVRISNARAEVVKTLHSNHSQIRRRVFRVPAAAGKWHDGLLLSEGGTGITLLFANPFLGEGALLATDPDRMRAGLVTSLVYLEQGGRKVRVVEGSARLVRR